MKLLVVDDDPMQLRALERTLGEHFELDTRESAGAALQALQSSRYDVLLVDQVLHEMRGTDLLSRARKVQPQAWRVLMSGYTEPGELLPAIDCGDVHRFLTKPVTADLLKTCTDHLRRQTSPGMLRCVVLDQDEARAQRIASALYETGEFLALPQQELNETGLTGLIVAVTPESPRRIEQLTSALGATARRCAVFVALDLGQENDAAGYLASGADDVVWLPVRADEVRLRYRTWRARQVTHQEAERVRTEALSQQPFPNIIGSSEAMRRVFTWVHRIAGTDSSVLFIGETGTGKELLARAVHSLSHRRGGPFLPVNLSALPESLIESELFGHEAGAFTGAKGGRKGRLEEADGGTLFLDEIGDLDLHLQVKLLRVLEDGKFARLGSNKERTTDFRLVCATNRDLEQLVSAGTFREDLYYRINVVRIDLPPLRERSADIPALAQHFLEHYRKRAGLDDLVFSDGAVEKMKHHDWPGNVRELEHMVERAVALSREGDAIGPDLVQGRPARRSFRKEVEEFWADGRGLREVLEDIERQILLETLQRYDGNRVAAARKLKIPRQTLQNRLKKLNIDA